ncbi:protein PALS1-like [Watersipora subatra]|uniref:protein PALS1-like n=1 Tax=Watersipora subatra TaxID=2589382 RepID=UPI00355BE90D
MMQMQAHNGSVNYSKGEMNMRGDDSLAHREMAIDVPSSFVPHPKERPRLTNSGKEEKLKKYQHDIKARKDQELRLQKEQDFLRASLRESKKLQNLEKRSGAANGNSASPDGFVNKAFDRDGGEYASMNEAVSDKTKWLESARVDVGKAVSTQQILNLLHALRAKLGNNSNELRVMNNLFNNVQFQDSVTLYNQVTKAKKGDKPTSSPPQPIAPDVYAAIQRSESKQAMQLRDILLRPPFKEVLLPRGHQAMLSTISADTQSPVSPVSSSSRVSAVEKADQYGESKIDIIHVRKTADPLGATVKNEGESVIIGRIVRGGVADKSGQLCEGDELLEVNGIPMRGKTINEVSDLLAGMTGELEFVLVPSGSQRYSRDMQERKTSVRALFDYDPEEDQFIPCQELGVSFTTGDILHVINQEDPNWWQAYREGEEDQALAGLVPSKLFWENREQLRLQILAETAEADNQTACCPSGKKKRKKSQYGVDEIDTDDILTYEEVTQYFPQPNRKRPIVLIGPPDVGRKELRQRLLETDSERFAAAIPHTSRMRREDEEDGKDYYFTAKHLFEADIRANKFVEHGHFQKDFYGTSLESIRQVVNSGKICVLNLHPQAIKSLRVSDVKPYVVFIAAPNMHILKENITKSSGKEPTVDHCRNIIDKGREMEIKYSHYFDFIINNSNISTAFQELLAEVNRLEVVPQWVPSEWLK